MSTSRPGGAAPAFPLAGTRGRWAEARATVRAMSDDQRTGQERKPYAADVYGQTSVQPIPKRSSLTAREHGVKFPFQPCTVFSRSSLPNPPDSRFVAERPFLELSGQAERAVGGVLRSQDGTV